nr:mitogen-activated protein kinase 2 [Tanacetum cinerariifolium]
MSESHIYVVFKLMESDLHHVIKANDDFTPEHYQYFLYQLLQGLKYIHTENFFHKDLNPKNILALALYSAVLWMLNKHWTLLLISYSKAKALEGYIMDAAEEDAGSEKSMRKVSRLLGKEEVRMSRPRRRT